MRSQIQKRSPVKLDSEARTVKLDSGLVLSVHRTVGPKGCSSFFGSLYDAFGPESVRGWHTWADGRHRDTVSIDPVLVVFRLMFITGKQASLDGEIPNMFLQRSLNC